MIIVALVFKQRDASRLWSNVGDTMKKQIVQIEEYERKILIGLRQLPVEKIAEVADFVEFLKTQSAKETRLGDTLTQIREEFENAGYTQKDIEKTIAELRAG